MAPRAVLTSQAPGGNGDVSHGVWQDVMRGNRENLRERAKSVTGKGEGIKMAGDKTGNG